VTRRQGSLTSMTVRAVCVECNSGWMSRIEEEARPILMPLIVGTTTTLCEAAIRTLSEWVTLKVMVAEHSPPPDPAIRLADKHTFYRARTIPDGISINLFWCGAPEWRIAYRRASATLSVRQHPNYDTRPKNAASIAFALGELFIHVVYFGDPEVRKLSLVGQRHGLAAWPPHAAELRWPPPLRISSDQAQVVSDAFQRFQNSPSVKVAP